jgi:hypothetical protein
VVSADAIRNFTVPNIPSFRISPPVPLSLAGATSNATPTVATSTFNILQPPAPTISQSLISIPVGYQFSFLQVRLPLSATNAISTYKVYRSASNLASATVIQSIPHHAANVGVPVVVQDAQPNGVFLSYWVSAVSIQGMESTLVPASSTLVQSKAGFNSNSQLASSFNSNPLNTSFSSNSATVLSNNGISPNITVNASTATFGAGNVAYNSGTLAPGTFGTWFATALDPFFQGGAVTYLVAPTNIFQTSSDGSLSWGKIVTASASSTTGGGSTGGSSASSSAAISAVSGRGLTF